ncbi:MAG: hypothetical protein KF678_12135 [Phycisphaeraceae bacterium]|nr:hypothetical protein [Phycisphaeraceae bacterium]
MNRALSLTLALAGSALPAAADVVTITFDHYPGPDNVLGTPDDVPIVAPSTFAAQTLQITDQFAALGIVFTTPPVENKNEILNNSSFVVPAGSTAPNLLASSGTLTIEAQFTVPVFRVGAIIGISGGSDRLEIFDAGGVSLGSIVGDDVEVSLSSTTPIARFVVSTFTGTTPTIDNLVFERASSCYANCDASTGNPLLTANDFQCFLNKYATGCS